MKGKPPNKTEKQWMDAICQHGCIVCLLFNGIYTEASPHHIDGKTKPGAHLNTIALCSRHHQTADTQKPPRWFTRHHNKSEFVRAYGTEQYLLEKTRELV